MGPDSAPQGQSVATNSAPQDRPMAPDSTPREQPMAHNPKPQNQSILCKIPGEIRNEICKLLLTDTGGIKPYFAGDQALNDKKQHVAGWVPITRQSINKLQNTCKALRHETYARELHFSKLVFEGNEEFLAVEKLCAYIDTVERNRPEGLNVPWGAIELRDEFWLTSKEDLGNMAVMACLTKYHRASAQWTKAFHFCTQHPEVTLDIHIPWSRSRYIVGLASASRRLFWEPVAMVHSLILHSRQTIPSSPNFDGQSAQSQYWLGNFARFLGAWVFLLNNVRLWPGCTPRAASNERNYFVSRFGFYAQITVLNIPPATVEAVAEEFMTFAQHGF